MSIRNSCKIFVIFMSVFLFNAIQLFHLYKIHSADVFLLMSEDIVLYSFDMSNFYGSFRKI